MRTARHTPVPSFFLYGEAAREVRPDFLHLEDLDERSRPSNWNIRPHAHQSLAHVFVITDGGGTMRTDGAACDFIAPALLLVPARVVHAFCWAPESQGRVLTISAAFLARILAAAPELADLFDAPRHVALPRGPAGLDAARPLLDRVGRELSWAAPARERALEACLITLLLDAWRLHAAPNGHAAPAGQAAPPAASKRLAERYVAAVEAEFRTQQPVGEFARALGTQPAALRAAVRRVTGRSPGALLRDRKMLEARRLLLYSNIAVAETAFALGFTDPAYFSRLFRAHTGVSPSSFRRHGGRST
jgi:AraC family transcriptional activator of pobA